MKHFQLQQKRKMEKAGRKYENKQNYKKKIIYIISMGVCMYVCVYAF